MFSKRPVCHGGSWVSRCNTAYDSQTRSKRGFYDTQGIVWIFIFVIETEDRWLGMFEFRSVCSKGGLTFSSVACPLDWGMLHVAELLGEAGAGFS